MADNPTKLVPDTLTLQARPPRATRLNRRVVGGGLAVLLLSGGLVLMLATPRPQERPRRDEATGGEVVLPEGMRGEPRYAQAPPTQPPPPAPAPPPAAPAGGPAAEVPPPAVAPPPQ